MPIFLFTDIEGSTQLWEKHTEDAMSKVLSRHNAILKEHIEAFGGVIIKHTGDGVFAVFEKGRPLHCALEVQRQFSQEDWNPIEELRVRMALHAGDAVHLGDDYFGPIINRTARVLAVGWGGQTLLTPEAVHASSMPPGGMLQDLGVHLLKDLGEPQQIYGFVHPDLEVQDFPSLRSLSEHPNNLPVQATPFWGREPEVNEVIERLDNPLCRLLTLVGPGGIGKTRLALHVAAEKIEDFPHGTYFVSLASIDSSELLTFHIAKSLNLSFYAHRDPMAQLLDYLSDKKMLLVLDNFEHLLDGTSLVVEILQRATGVKILATSRERLNLNWEWLVEIGGMRFPEDPNGGGYEEYDALQLFSYCAGRVKPDYDISDDDWPWVVRICQLLSGIPLGIELASSWMRTIPAKEIAAEIQNNLGFLESSLRDLPERHRSLKAAFDHSWNLLSDEEQNIFGKLSVFRGGFTREAAEVITGTSLGLLTGLVDKSLLKTASPGRYEMLEVLRQYVKEWLVEFPEEIKEVERLYGEHYGEFVHRRETDLVGSNQKEALEEIALDYENIRAGWSLTVEEGDHAHIDKYLEGLFSFYERRSMFREGIRTLQQAVEALHTDEDGSDEGSSVRTAILAKTLVRQARFYYNLDNHTEATELLNRSLSIFRQIDAKAEMAFTIYNMGLVAHRQGRYLGAKELFQESLTTYREIGDRHGIADSLNHLGLATYRRDEYSGAMRLFKESIAIYKELGDLGGLSNCLDNMGVLIHGVGDYDEAKKINEESLAISKEIADPWSTAISLNNLGLVALAKGDYPESTRLLEESLAIKKEIGNQSGICRCLNDLGRVAYHIGEYDEANRLFTECLDISTEINYQWGIARALSGFGHVSMLQKKLADAENWHQRSLDISKETGNRWGVAISLGNLGTVSLESGDNEEAINLLQESIELSTDIGNEWARANCFNLLGRVAMAQGEDNDVLTYLHESLDIATRIQAVPIALDALITAADYVAKRDEIERAVDILSLVVEHSATQQETKQRASDLLVTIQLQMPSELTKAASARSKPQSLEQTTKEILHILAE